MDFYILLDNTPSMGVGATPTDVSKLEAKTGCAFACHQMDQSTNNYTIAKGLGVAMCVRSCYLFACSVRAPAGPAMIASAAILIKSPCSTTPGMEFSSLESASASGMRPKDASIM